MGHHRKAGVFSSDGEAGPKEQLSGCPLLLQTNLPYHANQAFDFLKGVISFGRKTKNYPSGRSG
jgi:hypothetical protein